MMRSIVEPTPKKQNMMLIKGDNAYYIANFELGFNKKIENFNFDYELTLEYPYNQAHPFQSENGNYFIIKAIHQIDQQEKFYLYSLTKDIVQELKEGQCWVYSDGEGTLIYNKEKEVTIGNYESIIQQKTFFCPEDFRLNKQFKNENIEDIEGNTGCLDCSVVHRVYMSPNQQYIELYNEEGMRCLFNNITKNIVNANLVPVNSPCLFNLILKDKNGDIIIGDGKVLHVDIDNNVFLGNDLYCKIDECDTIQYATLDAKENIWILKTGLFLNDNAYVAQNKPIQSICLLRKNKQMTKVLEFTRKDDSMNVNEMLMPCSNPNSNLIFIISVCTLDYNKIKTIIYNSQTDTYEIKNGTLNRVLQGNVYMNKKYVKIPEIIRPFKFTYNNQTYILNPQHGTYIAN